QPFEEEVLAAVADLLVVGQPEIPAPPRGGDARLEPRRARIAQMHVLGGRGGANRELHLDLVAGLEPHRRAERLERGLAGAARPAGGTARDVVDGDTAHTRR